MEEKYCIICYEPISNSELVEIPTPSYEPDKFAHQDCFLTKMEELASDATRGKMLRYILAYEKNNDINYLRDKSKSGISGWEAQTIGLPSQKLVECTPMIGQVGLGKSGGVLYYSAE